MINIDEQIKQVNKVICDNIEMFDNDIKKYERCKNNDIRLIRVAEKKQNIKDYDYLLLTKPNDTESLGITISNLISYLCNKKIDINIEKYRNEIYSLLEKRRINLIEKYTYTSST